MQRPVAPAYLMRGEYPEAATELDVGNVEYPGDGEVNVAFHVDDVFVRLDAGVCLEEPIGKVLSVGQMKLGSVACGAGSELCDKAMGPKAGWRNQRLGGQPVLLPPSLRHLCADADGFNVHAHTSVGPGHKEERERLCRYILRPALSGKRLSLLPSGDVLFRLKRPWSDGTRSLVFPPIAFLEKLAVLVPPPNRHL